MCPRIAIETAADFHVSRRRHRRNDEDSFVAVRELGLFMAAAGLDACGAHGEAGQVGAAMTSPVPAIEGYRTAGQPLAASGMVPRRGFPHHGART